MKPILEIQNIGKKYQIQHLAGGYLSLRERMVSALKFERNTTEDFWALKNISFEVQPGESIGIIGRNGAGKSTLLKILSKITPPTTGRIVSRGRIASLLEVGTGFHPELTGRENIFFNGSLLGMKRKEIEAKFDDIVDFSGVEKFLDTPLKHFSSGMQLRLAFAVAAYLDPEILIIDEVLAVGDSAFQKKCTQKMSEVSNQGRTILFVSHNMQAVRSICSKAIMIRSGEIMSHGLTDPIIEQYLSEGDTERKSLFDLSEKKRPKGKHGLTFSSLHFDKLSYQVGDVCVIRINLKSDGHQYKDLLFGVNFYDSFGNCVIHLSNIFVHKIDVTHNDLFSYKFVVNSLSLKPGKYSVNLFLRANEDIQDWLDGSASIEIVEGNIYGFENSQMIQGLLQPDFSFEQVR